MIPQCMLVLFRSSALLGLIDDVDCAVVSLAFTKDPASPVQLQHVATIPALAYVATGAPAHQWPCMQVPRCPDRSYRPVLFRHGDLACNLQAARPKGVFRLVGAECCMSTSRYAGKTQRKYVLLGKPGSGIAAVIVEANRFAYVYHEPPPGQPHGKYQVRLTPSHLCTVQYWQRLYTSAGRRSRLYMCRFVDTWCELRYSQTQTINGRHTHWPNEQATAAL